jgi:hypothetical protein
VVGDAAFALDESHFKFAGLLPIEFEGENDVCIALDKLSRNRIKTYMS